LLSHGFLVNPSAGELQSLEYTVTRNECTVTVLCSYYCIELKYGNWYGGNLKSNQVSHKLL